MRRTDRGGGGGRLAAAGCAVVLLVVPPAVVPDATADAAAVLGLAGDPSAAVSAATLACTAGATIANQ